MDCYSAESEFIESLDFLSPPVKRIHNSREAFGSTYHNEANDVHLLRGLRNKFARRAPSSTKNSKTVKTNAESSTSLILKRTSERKILEHYSIVSYTSLHPEDRIPQRKSDRITNSEKPLIKVTVIPKSDQLQTAKILRKRRFIPKRVESTTSNHENSIQTKNVYLIVAGRRKEKIYEIKTTGSATLSTDRDSCAKDDEIPIKELSNFKHLIQSLNMDRKKRKEKQTPVPSDAVEAPQQTLKYEGYPKCRKCTKDDDSKEGTPKKGHVRIFGQFGISDDDKYVLRYGATVNNRQVLSDVAQLTRDFTPVIMPMTSYGTTQDEHTELQKDSCIQADYDNELEIEQLPVRDKVPSKESQGTQVNFNVHVSTTKGNSLKFSDKKVQCSCYNMENRSDYNRGLKECQSPLVIISVYPKQSPEDIASCFESPAENIMRVPSPPKINTYTSSQILKMDRNTKRNNIESVRSIKSPSISRSPSPIKKASRSTLQEDKSSKARLIEKRSPDRQKALKAIKQKIQEKDKLKQDASTKKTSKFRTSNSTQVSKNLQNLTVSNATQVSHKNQQVYSASNATQVSKNHPTFTASNATQYSSHSNPQSLMTVSNGMQCVDSPNYLAPIKHSKNIEAFPQNTTSSINHPKPALASNATQKTQVFVSNATQVSKNGRGTVSNATQVSKNQQNFIASRVFKNQETSVRPVKTIKNEPRSRSVLKSIAERGTNTEHARAKKALVETYTQKLTETMNQMDFVPAKYDNSKVTINIDGDKEYYDVLFNQDKMSTDLTIRKTLKEMASQKDNEERCSPSLENVLYIPSANNNSISDRRYVPDCIMEKGIPGDKSPTNSFSIALCKTASEDGTPLGKTVSRLTIRDSLEISHRREDKGNINNIKNTQTCFTAQFAENIPDETEFLAPIKHYTGDDCSICNPVERDKQIRELLGVEKNLTYPKEARSCENGGRFPYQCIYRQECKKSQVTEINFQFQKICPCFKPLHSGKQKSVQSASVQCRYHNDSNSGGKCCVSRVRYADDIKEESYGDSEYAIDNYNKAERNKNKEKPALYQQLILNRNVQVFLQLDQFSKQKPIILSRKQYDKVKKTIQKTICKKRSSHDKRKKAVSNKSERSVVSVGEVRIKKLNDATIHNEKEAQTDLVPCNKESCRNKHATKWDNRSRRGKSSLKHDSSDQSLDQSGDRPVEKLRKAARNIERSGERYHARSHSQKKRRSSEKHRERKPKRCTKVYLEPSASSSLSSNEKTRKIQEEQKAVRIVESPTQRHTQNHTEPSSEQKDFGTVVLLSEQKESHIPEQYSDRKESHSDQRLNYIDRKKSGSLERYNEQKDNHISEIYNERKRDRSHDQDSERKNIRKKKTRDCEMCFKEYDDIEKDNYSDDRESERKEIHNKKVRDCGICFKEYDDIDKDNRSDDRESERKEIRKKKALECEMCFSEYENINKDTAKEHKGNEIKTLILFNADNIKGNPAALEAENETHNRKTLSSVEIRYASVAYMKQIAYSSTDVGALSDSSIAHVNSFRTIFRGHRKSPTPNLGTSAYSLYSEDILNSDTKCAKFIMEPRDSKPKKPFLRRLMSCLVMRSTRDSELKLPTGPAPDIPSVNSSIDSYHISTSLGAVEVSSSIYDTSASFYSNHTILPVNSKIKRGFFSSVRGFLTNRKS